MTQFIITAVGPDRPGIVGELTAHLHAAGANLLDSRMVNLRGQFAMVLMLECPEDKAAMLRDSLAPFGERIGMKISVEPQRPAPQHVEGMRYRLRTYSMDQPGIVARVSGVLRAHGVNIEELSARQESAAFAGHPLFLTEIKLTIPPDVSIGKLRQELQSVGAELNCDIDLDPEG